MILGGHHFAGANDAALCFKLYVAGSARGVVQMQFRLDRGLSGLRGEAGQGPPDSGNHSLDTFMIFMIFMAI